MVPDQPVRRDAPRQKLHLYAFTVDKGQLIVLELTQVNADLSMTLISPTGAILCRQDSFNQDMGLERIGWEAGMSGRYMLEVSQNDPDQAGYYRLRLSPFREPNEKDRQRLAADEILQKLRESSLGDDPESICAQLETVRSMKRRIGDDEEAALLYLEEAEIREREAEWEKVIEAYLKAAAFYAEATVPWRQRMLGNIHHSLGAFYYRCGAFEKAIDHNERALFFRAEPDLSRAQTLIEQGFIYGVMGVFEKGRGYFVEAADILKQRPHPETEVKLLVQEGNLKNLAGYHESALEAFRRAFELIQVHELPANVTLLDRYAKVLLRKGQVDDALGMLREAGRHSANHSQRWVAIVDGNIAELLNETGRFQEALTGLEQTQAFFSDKLEPASKAFIHYQKARAKHGLADQTGAIRSMEACMALVKQMRNGSKSLSLRANYTAAHYEYLEFYVDLLMEAGQPYIQRAFLAVERTRARNFVTRLHDPKTASKNDREFVSLKNQISTLAWRLNQESAPNADDRQKLDRLLSRYHQVSERTAGEKSSREKPMPKEPASFKEYQNLIEAGTVVLYYVMGTESAWLWRMDQRSIKPFPLGERDSLETKALDYFHAVREQDVHQFLSRTKTTGLALSRRLFPEAALPPRETRLVIIADGALLYVPFAALPYPTEPETPLVVYHELSYLHSMTVLDTLRRRPRHGGNGELLVFADPLYDPDTPFPPLTHSAQEAEAIKAYDEAKVRVFTGSEAGKAQLLQNISEASLVHFAVHGLTYGGHGDLSALVLAQRDAAGNRIDCFLRTHEIAATPLKADLVVLSSCRSALGQNMRGEGFVGLAQSFLEAGAGGVIVGLWDLEDRATAALMAHFYHALRVEGKSPAAALRAAQINMWRREEHHPAFYWGAFQYLGDWRLTLKQE